MRISDYAGNSGEGGDKTCSKTVEVFGCCDTNHITGWQNGSTCYNSKRKKVSCGGGNYDRFKYSNLNGQQCARENNAGSKCATKSCCSSSNYKGCDWVTACRKGNTAVFTSSSMNLWAGVVRHKNGGEDYLYILEKKGSVMKVRTSGFGEHYTSQHSGYVVWIYTRCTGPANKVCPYSQCPG